MNPQIYGNKFIRYAKRQQQKLSKNKRNEVVDQHITEAVVRTCGDMLHDVVNSNPKSDAEFYELLDEKEEVWKAVVEVLNHRIRPFKLTNDAFRLYVYDAHPFLKNKWVERDGK